MKTIGTIISKSIVGPIILFCVLYDEIANIKGAM